MAQRATSLGPKPSLFLFVFWVVSFFLFLFFVFFGGFKGEVRWPKGPPHLALNPPYFLFVFLFLFFPCLPFCVSFHRKTLFPPPKKGILGFFLSVSLCFSLAFFGPPPLFTFSLFVSLSLSLLLFSFFLPFCFSFLYPVLAVSFCFVCFLFQDVTCLFFSLLSCFVLNQNI